MTREFARLKVLIWKNLSAFTISERKQIYDLLNDSLLIPKPKFKVGDHVCDKINSDPYEDYDFIIKSVFYNIEEGTYYYHGAEMDYIRSEDDLELVEAVK